VLLHHDTPSHLLIGNLAKLGPVYANPLVPRAGEVRLQKVVEQRLAFWEITIMHDTVF
jgi:hypothetical protein